MRAELIREDAGINNNIKINAFLKVKKCLKTRNFAIRSLLTRESRVQLPHGPLFYEMK
jgi:hypothetical protein